MSAVMALTKGTDGLLHISNVKPGERVENVEDVLKRGDQLAVRVVERDAVVVEPDDGLGHGCSFGTSGDGLEAG